jgi:hypothetical protein
MLDINIIFHAVLPPVSTPWLQIQHQGHAQLEILLIIRLKLYFEIGIMGQIFYSQYIPLMEVFLYGKLLEYSYVN